MSADPSGLQSYWDNLLGVLKGYWKAINPISAIASLIQAPRYWFQRGFDRLTEGSSNILTVCHDLNNEFLAIQIAFYTRKEAWDFEHPEIFGETFGSGLVTIGGFMAGFAESPGLTTTMGGRFGLFGPFSEFEVAGQFGIQSCKVLRQLKSGIKGLQAHHLLERRFGPLFGQAEGDMLGIVLTDAEHLEITRAWRREIGYVGDRTGITTKTATRTDVIKAARRVYAPYPALLKQLLNSLGEK